MALHRTRAGDLSFQFQRRWPRTPHVWAQMRRLVLACADFSAKWQRVVVQVLNKFNV